MTNRYALHIGRWELGIVKCGSWHWRPVAHFYRDYFEFDWGRWLFFAGVNAYAEFEEEWDFYEDQRRLR